MSVAGLQGIKRPPSNKVAFDRSEFGDASSAAARICKTWGKNKSRPSFDIMP
jgi:hypothetical protein